VLCFALSGYSLSANVMETLVKKGMKIEEIKKAASGLKVSDRLFLLFNTYKEYAGIGLGERKAGRRIQEF
jgi:hypothetical protein